MSVLHTPVASPRKAIFGKGQGPSSPAGTRTGQGGGETLNGHPEDKFFGRDPPLGKQLSLLPKGGMNSPFPRIQTKQSARDFRLARLGSVALDYFLAGSVALLLAIFAMEANPSGS